MRSSWMILLAIVVLFLPGCATTRPTVEIQIRGDVKEKPEYSVTINL